MKENKAAWRVLKNAAPAYAQEADLLEEGHIATSLETPMRADAFDLHPDEKVERIAEKVKDILEILGMDLTDDSLRGTPLRVAKMYVHEVFQGLDPRNMPDVKLFENKFGYGQMLIERDITVHSYCEHHLVPIIGKAHVAYISSGKVIGLSKLNRIVRHFAKRPQVQERLTEQIAAELKRVLETDDVAVILEAEHFCVMTRGIADHNSLTVTSHYSGKFEQPEYRQEFLHHTKPHH